MYNLRPFKIFTVALAAGGRAGLVEATGKWTSGTRDKVERGPKVWRMVL